MKKDPQGLSSQPWILVVDDDEFVRHALCQVLRRKDFMVRDATNGTEALNILATGTFAAVISDENMPGISGVELLTRVRDQYPDIERILFTAYAEPEALERGINDAGLTRILRKPCAPEMLVAVARDVLERYRLKRENEVLVTRLENRYDELRYLNSQLRREHSESSRELTTFRRLWDVALNAISDPVILVNEGYTMAGANQAAATLAHVEIEAMEGQKCYTALFGRQSPCDNCPLLAHASRITVIGDDGGEERIFDARAYALPDAEKGAHLCVYRDVTQEVLLGRESIQMEKMAAIGRLAGNVAHELNNPLSGIMSFAELAQRPGLEPQKAARYLTLISECAVRCRDIILNLRDFSRKPGLDEKRPTRLELVCDKALMLFLGGFETRLERIIRAPDAICEGNANELAQVVVNLVQNAVDAGSASGTIRVIVDRQGDDVVLAVEDDGPGISEALRSKIFEPFFTTKPEGQGTGLGLAISHSIVRDHRGTLTVSSAQTGGARFEMRLPAAQAQTEAQAQTQEAAHVH